MGFGRQYLVLLREGGGLWKDLPSTPGSLSFYETPGKSILLHEMSQDPSQGTGIRNVCLCFSTVNSSRLSLLAWEPENFVFLV